MSNSEGYQMQRFLESLKKFYSLLGLKSVMSLTITGEVGKAEPKMYLEKKLQTMEVREKQIEDRTLDSMC